MGGILNDIEGWSYKSYGDAQNEENIIVKSKDLRRIKKVDVSKRKRILLLNPKLRTTDFQVPHNGLAILAVILKNRGHEVLVADYAFMYEEQDTDVSFFIKMFNPDVVGISIYTANINEANEMILRVHEFDPNIPIMVGGPHALLYFDLLQKDKRIDYIFVGEAELTIIDVVEKAKKEKNPEVVWTKEVVDLNDIPFPDYRAFYRWESMTVYPIMTSRGCPYHCSFCAASSLCYRKWRPRKPEDCIRELEIAKETISPYLSVSIMDNTPTVDKERFYEFLDLFSKRIKIEVVPFSTRGDGVDDKLLTLLKKCGCHSLSIGVEHAHPEVFKLITKGETIEQIEKACNLIKKHKMKLGLFFIIGLPGDNLERTKESIRFYRKVKADGCNILSIIPYRHTAVRKWFEEHGAKLYNEMGRDAMNHIGFECIEPVVETPDFTSEDRKKAYYMFLFEVAHSRLKLRKLPRIFAVAIKYNLYSDFFYWLPRGILRSLQTTVKYLKSALNIYRRQGFDQLIKRYRYLQDRRVDR